MILNQEEENNGYDVDLYDGDCAIVFPKDKSTPFLVITDGTIKEDELVPDNIIAATELLIKFGEDGFYDQLLQSFTSKRIN